jgi:Na+/proline symporter
MRTLDWVVLSATTVAIIGYGMYRGRGSTNIRGFLLADRSMKWYTVALAIMATQASAITFTSTPGQAFVDGMRFVQFYFGLPVAMVILSMTAVPIFHKLNVFTAYEYLELRFDLKTRLLTGAIFLIARGLAAGMTIYAPSIVLSVILGWDVRITSAIIGGLVIMYTAGGGVKAVNWTDFQQMLVIMAGMVLAFVMTIMLLPEDISFPDALTVAGGMGRLNAVDFSFDLTSRYNFWSGLIGGTFVALAYFGTDQSQVQRYLTGRSVTQSRLGLLFNGIAKVPMQFFILLLGAMVFVFYQFVQPPMVFNPVQSAQLRDGPRSTEYRQLEKEYGTVFSKKSEAIRTYVNLRGSDDAGEIAEARQEMAAMETRSEALRNDAKAMLGMIDPSADTNDTNYIFLHFVTTVLPSGIVGLIFACIFFASMSSSSGELSALATTSVIDIYRRLLKPEASERHYLLVSRGAMVFWGLYAIGFSHVASRLGSLVEAVNIVGSLFYGTMLGIFLLAFYVRRVGGTAVFWSALLGEAVVLYCFSFTTLPWLWYNVVGCGVVVASAVALSYFQKEGGHPV